VLAHPIQHRAGHGYFALKSSRDLSKLICLETKSITVQ
jgi:hypothetical protein